MQVQYRPLYGLRSEQERGPGQQQAPGGHGGGRGAGVMPVLAARSRSEIQSITSVKKKFKDQVDIEKNFPHHFLLDKTNANVGNLKTVAVKTKQMQMLTATVLRLPTCLALLSSCLSPHCCSELHHSSSNCGSSW